MPIHDWTRVSAGDYHDFHQDWTIELRRRLNAGLLPAGYRALTDQRVEGWEPDITSFFTTTIQSDDPTPGGVAVAEHPPTVRAVARPVSAAGAYARRANQIAIRHPKGHVTAIIEIVSPGNKDREHSVNQFVAKVREFLRKGVHVLFVDLFPPGDHDPDGLDAAVWSVWTDTPGDRPADKPLTAASYDAGNLSAAYVAPLAVGDPLPEMPLFIRPGVYIPCPLEESYMTSWAALPAAQRADIAG